jgi:predicted small secreted protein
MKKRLGQCILLIALVVLTVFTVTACKSEKQMIGKGKDYKLSIGDEDTQEWVLTFDANGGVSLYEVVVSDGDSVVIPACTRVGYKFLYWEESSGTKYYEGDSITLNSDVTLTAQWEEDATAVLYGDVNGDGNVNKLDRAYLVRYLAKWPEYPAEVINMAAADVNCDGNVNKLDRAILIRYLAKWPEYDKLPYVK